MSQPADCESTAFPFEIVQPLGSGPLPRHALFDFDGTLSLIRQGWQEVMTGLMLEILCDTGTSESEEELTALILDFITELTGKQTIYQMIRLTEEVERRGKKPQEPLVYKREYNDRLLAKIADRREALRAAELKPEDLLVKGSYAFLDALREWGVKLHLASGTDEQYVKEEAALLGLPDYFEGRIFGAQDDYKSFSKAMVIERLICEEQIDGAELIGFGDGYVEIENVKTAGGTSIGLATDETGESDQPDAWKRERLIAAGADVIVADFQPRDQILAYLFQEVK